MSRTASPKIVLSKETLNEEVRGQIQLIMKEIHDARCSRLRTMYFFRTPGEDGYFNANTLSTALHRASIAQHLYFVDPVIFNYDNAISAEEAGKFISQLRYTELGRIYWVDLKPDMTFKLSLLVNQNTNFKMYSDIEVLTPQQVSKRESA